MGTRVLGFKFVLGRATFQPMIGSIEKASAVAGTSKNLPTSECVIAHRRLAFSAVLRDYFPHLHLPPSMRTGSHSDGACDYGQKAISRGMPFSFRNPLFRAHRDAGFSLVPNKVLVGKQERGCDVRCKTSFPGPFAPHSLARPCDACLLVMRRESEPERDRQRPRGTLGQTGYCLSIGQIFHIFTRFS